MTPATVEVVGAQMQRFERSQVFPAQRRELVEQARERSSFRFHKLREAIELLEWLRLAVVEDEAGTRDPVGPFAVNQVPDDVERAPGVATFVFAATHPSGRPRTSASSVEGVRDRTAIASSMTNGRRVRSGCVVIFTHSANANEDPHSTSSSAAGGPGRAGVR